MSRLRLTTINPIFNGLFDFLLCMRVGHNPSGFMAPGTMKIGVALSLGLILPTACIKILLYVNLGLFQAKFAKLGQK